MLVKKHNIIPPLLIRAIALILLGVLLTSCATSEMTGQPTAHTIDSTPTGAPKPTILPINTPEDVDANQASENQFDDDTDAEIDPLPTSGDEDAEEETKPSDGNDSGLELSQTADEEILSAADEEPTIEYFSQSGDTLLAVAAHFGVSIDEITSAEPIPETEFINPGQLLIIYDRLDDTGPEEKLLPDSEVIFSKSAVDFNTHTFVNDANGYINNYGELLGNGWYSGAELVQQIGLDFSINPRLLLALLEYQGRWVYGKPTTKNELHYPLGYFEPENKDLFPQLRWAADQLNAGYYGWRDGSLTELTFPDGSQLRIEPQLNAGTVAIQYLFSKLYNQDQWYGILYGEESIALLHTRMFGDAWARAERIEPLIPGYLSQPEMELPIEPDRPWNLTGGPHSIWGVSGPWAALDLAPTGVKGCAISGELITASAPGLVVRVGEGPILVDMDGDGIEQTGWNILYMHIASKNRVSEGTYVETDDVIGHPSCYGGRSTGTHVHFGRKYNGEWIIAEGPIPYVLSGWTARNGIAAYKGELIKNGESVVANDYSEMESLIIR